MTFQGFILTLLCYRWVCSTWKRCVWHVHHHRHLIYQAHHLLLIILTQISFIHFIKSIWAVICSAWFLSTCDCIPSTFTLIIWFSTGRSAHATVLSSAIYVFLAFQITLHIFPTFCWEWALWKCPCSPCEQGTTRHTYNCGCAPTTTNQGHATRDVHVIIIVDALLVHSTINKNVSEVN